MSDQERSQKIQKALRGQGDEAYDFEEVLEAELEAIREGRRLREGTAEKSPKPHGDDAYARAHDMQLSALGFSGGGIRSATFNLGVAQGLARLGLLRRFDYLSVNSGGGYIGGWLEAWIRRAGLREVERELRSDACRDDEPEREPRSSEPGSRAREADRSTAEAAPISFLRAFSNYLTPRVGAFSADTWTMVATYLRNLLLNQVILVLALAAALLIPRILVLASAWLGAFDPLVLVGCAAVFLVLAIAMISLNQVEVLLPREVSPPWYARQGGVQLAVVLPLFVAAWFGGLWMWFSEAASQFFLRDWLAERWSWYGESASHQEQFEPLAWAILAAALYLFAWIAGCLLFLVGSRRREGGEAEPMDGRRLLGAVLLTAPLAGLVGGFLLWAVAWGSQALESMLIVYDYQEPWHLLHVTVWKAPAIIVVFMLTAFLHTGLMGRAFRESLREWWSRLGAWMLIWAVTWLGMFTISLYGPIVLVVLGALICTGLASGWIASTVGGIVVARRNRIPGENDRPPLWHRLVVAAAPQIFIIGMLATIALGVHALLDPPTELLSPECQEFWIDESDVQGSSSAANSAADQAGSNGRQRVALETTTIRNIVHCHTERMYEGTVRDFPGGNPITVPAVLLVFGFVALGLSSRVDINEFSMHLFYRNRLIRAYLGASNQKRKAQPFTGFDPNDDLPVASFSPYYDGPEGPYDGPYPIHNITLNLVKGEELAWQERKAASFVFTPLFSGFEVRNGEAAQTSRLEPGGFRSTRRYEQTGEGISLGTAMTISGAAASPAMGEGTTPAMAFLLTVFNVRLGWWLGNPRHRDTWRRMGPKVGFMALLTELFGAAQEESRYVYLSDGGHFDNLALYELIRRRCRFIVISDAGADPEFTFADLGNSVRKCCTDFGVEIDLDPSRIRKVPDTGLSPWHCAVGKIRYDKIEEGASPGILVYLKASRSGDEPVDTQAYAAAHEAFPHEPTSDQWFSESQFESYRKLGEHVALTVFGRAADHPGGLPREALFVRMEETWYPPTSASPGAFTQLTARLDALMTRLGQEQELDFLTDQVYPEWGALTSGTEEKPAARMWLPNQYQEFRAGFFFCHSLIQLMEDVYLDLDLEEQHGHPDNRGWMNLFKHWSWSGMVRATWAVTAGTFGARFQTFCKRRLDLELGRLELEEHALAGQEAAAPLLDQLETDNRLNFLEVELVRELVRRNPRGVDRLFLLRLAVWEPQREATGEGSELRFTFGFAVARKGELLFLRVQDHLRCMGLGRRALRGMVRDRGVESIGRIPRERLPDYVRETAGEAQFRRLMELFRSVVHELSYHGSEADS